LVQDIQTDELTTYGRGVTLNAATYRERPHNDSHGQKTILSRDATHKRRNMPSCGVWLACICHVRVLRRNG